MKLFRLILVMVATCLLCSAGFAGEDYTMASGRVLKNAYVVERKPNGVVVGHSCGVMFVKYKKMPEDLREKLGYDPAKCARYEEKKRKKKKARREHNAAERAKKTKLEKELNIRRGQYKIVELEDKIKETKLRIKRLKKEIPKLETDSKGFLNQVVKLSSVTSSSNNGFSRNGFWGGGSSSSDRSSNRREVKDRYKAVSAIGDEYSKSKFRLSNYKDELEKKTLDLEKMKRHLAKLKKDQGVKEGKKGFLSKLF
ncbi:MAG: hypothetical protein KAS17_12570 [Victivallaceae bacterium]|nr:hypothetical protein [Victivallaceae bacterium]